jgi:hypothetical protein
MNTVFQGLMRIKGLSILKHLKMQRTFRLASRRRQIRLCFPMVSNFEFFLLRKITKTFRTKFTTELNAQAVQNK